jgi:hypothetical protein
MGGGGIPHPTIPNPTPSPNPVNLQTLQMTPSFVSDFDNKFESIRIEINSQWDCNARFGARISYLEVSTRSIDSKMDQVLACLAPPPHPLPKKCSVPTLLMMILCPTPV